MTEAKETSNGNQVWKQVFDYDRYGNRTTYDKWFGVSVLSITLFLSSCLSQTLVSNRVTIIPHDFRGIGLIIFDETTAARFEKEESKIIYRVPRSGVLRTLPPPSEFFQTDEYFFEEPDGTLKPIRYLYPAGGAYADKDATFDSIPADSTEVFCMLDSLWYDPK